MIYINNYTKRIHDKIILNNICLELEEGKIYGIVGKNGSGKTMFLRAICGLIKPTSGEIVLPLNTSFGALIETPGFMFDQSALFNLEYLASLNKKATKETIEIFLRFFELYDCRKQKVKKFSLGMQQKLGIIQAIMDDPNIIILDEPFNALDERSVQQVKELLLKINNDNNSTIFLASHDLKAIEEISDHIIMVDSGTVKI